ncbi:hypothetical protein FOL01_1992 [Weissella jogaejeotgali]|uniref:Uncharacterized protein n=1 Tax=Weissella jogaejeotgali TaxID=1631871 RepID=A0A1L6RE90_9LACO|nr:hypothetical protein FOL01_1992 [Weissella jogaejeotgali]
MATVLALAGTGAPATIILADSTENNTSILTDDEIKNGLSDVGKEKYAESLNGTQIQTRGVKQKAVVYALKYGGKYLSDIVEILSKENAKILKEHSYEIAGKLEKLDKYGEGQLASFIMKLGVKSTAVRTIAWAVMFVAF